MVVMFLWCVQEVHEWFDLGLHLRVKYGALKAIEADYRKVKQCMREMLAAWLKGQGGECTKHTLRTALLNIDCKIHTY